MHIQNIVTKQIYKNMLCKKQKNIKIEGSFKSNIFFKNSQTENESA